MNVSSLIFQEIIQPYKLTPKRNVMVLYVLRCMEAALQIRYSQTQQSEMASTLVLCFIFNVIKFNFINLLFCRIILKGLRELNQCYKY